MSIVENQWGCFKAFHVLSRVLCALFLVLAKTKKGVVFGSYWPMS